MGQTYKFLEIHRCARLWRLLQAGGLKILLDDHFSIGFLGKRLMKFFLSDTCVQNTADSLKYARQLWSTVGQASQFKRSVAFVAALSLQHAQPATTIQMLQSLTDDYFVTEQIKLIALAQLSYVNETNEALAKWAACDRLRKHKISKDVVRGIVST